MILHRRGLPGYVRAEGSLVPGPVPVVVPPDPEPGELPLEGEIMFPRRFPSHLTITIETCTDLQTWVPLVSDQVIKYADRMTFPLPAGQGRGFYRLKATLQ